jgi:hypothetical protein
MVHLFSCRKVKAFGRTNFISSTGCPSEHLVQLEGNRCNILNWDWQYVGCHHADEVNGVINSWVQVFTNNQ